MILHTCSFAHRITLIWFAYHIIVYNASSCMSNCLDKMLWFFYVSTFTVSLLLMRIPPTVFAHSHPPPFNTQSIIFPISKLDLRERGLNTEHRHFSLTQTWVMKLCIIRIYRSGNIWAQGSTFVSFMLHMYNIKMNENSSGKSCTLRVTSCTVLTQSTPNPNLLIIIHDGNNKVTITLKNRRYRV